MGCLGPNAGTRVAVVEEEVCEAPWHLERRRAPRVKGGGELLSDVCRDLWAKVLISRLTSASHKS